MKGIIKKSLNTRERRDITNDLANLSATVAEQNLEKYGYKIGDYFIGTKHDGSTYPYTYILADLDTFYGGYDDHAILSTHHITIVVDANKNIQWNTINSTSSGYSRSNLHDYLVNTVLPGVQSDFTTLFGSSSHLLSHWKLLTIGISTTGEPAWNWQTNQYISALTSVQLYGSPICDIDFSSTGEGSKQLEVFQKYFYPEILGNQNTWLRSIASSSHPCFATNVGYAYSYFNATHPMGAVGLIIFH